MRALESWQDRLQLLIQEKAPTLRRMSFVTMGDANFFDAFSPAAEWDGLGPTTSPGLGHTQLCQNQAYRRHKGAGKISRPLSCIAVPTTLKKQPVQRQKASCIAYLHGVPMRHLALYLLAVSALLDCHLCAQASVHTVDFTSGSGEGSIDSVGSPGGTGINRYSEEGMLFATSDSGHHIELFGAAGASVWSSTPLGVFPWHRNVSDPADPDIIHVSLGGAAFDLLSLTVRENPFGLTFSSSSGSVFHLSNGITGGIPFSAIRDEWQNITGFSMRINGGDPSAIHAIDNVVFDDLRTTSGAAPEPFSFVIWSGLACARGLVGRRLRR
jgi:hypothetical protein